MPNVVKITEYESDRVTLQLQQRLRTNIEELIKLLQSAKPLVARLARKRGREKFHDFDDRIFQLGCFIHDEIIEPYLETP